MKDDILEKGAIIQRDRETFAIAPHVPGGFMEVSQFKRLVDVAEKYNATAMKLTSGQRIALLGLQEEQLDDAWKELEMDIGYAIGLCVRMVKFCPGTTYCRHGKQDAMAIGRELDKKYHGMMLPAKFKIGVSGCKYACNAPIFKEVGLRGRTNGWQVYAGGTCGAIPRMGDLLAENVSTEEALDITERVVSFFRDCCSEKKVRLGRVIDKIGLDTFKKEINIE